MMAAVSDQSWLARMLEVEAALAAAEADSGVIPVASANLIAAACEPARFDAGEIGRQAVAAGNPVIPLVRELTARVPEPARGHVHWGATSQDVLDTAMMLVIRDGIDLLLPELDRVVAACAAHAIRHRTTLMAGRTLLQQATPITFGLKAAGWLAGAGEAAAALAGWRRHRLALQFGGAAGTLAALDGAGLIISARLAARLELPEPPLPWHTARGRVAELGGALAVVAGSMGKIGADILLLAQTEVAEVEEPTGPGRGGSSAMPHKRNPVFAQEIATCARGVFAQAGLLQAAMIHEHERAAGAWQAEWPAVAEALRLTAGAVGRAAEVLEGLVVHPERMRANLGLSGGLILSERVSMALAARLGRHRAQRLVTRLAGQAAAAGGFEATLRADPEVAAIFSEAQIAELMDPAAYLGMAEALIDRALEAYAGRK